MLTINNTTQPARTSAIDVVALHRKYGHQIRGMLVKKGVNYAELDDAYVETLARVIDKAPTEYNPDRAAPQTYACLKARSVAAVVRKRQYRTSSTCEFASPEDTGCDDAYESGFGLAPFGAAPAQDSEAESLLAVQGFLAALLATLPSGERAVLDHCGLAGLQPDLAERVIAAAKLGITTETLRKRLIRIRNTARKLWPEHFNSVPPMRGDDEHPE